MVFVVTLRDFTFLLHGDVTTSYISLYQPVGYNLDWLSRHGSIQIILLCVKYAADFKALNSLILVSC